MDGLCWIPNLTTVVPLSVIPADTVSLIPSGIHQTDHGFVSKLLFLGTTMAVQCLVQQSPGTCVVVNEKKPQGSSCRIAFGQHCKEKPETLSLLCKLSQQLRKTSQVLSLPADVGVKRKRGNISSN